MLFTDFILGHLQVTYISLSGSTEDLHFNFLSFFCVKNKYAYLNQICCVAYIGGGIINSQCPYTPNQQTNTHSGGGTYLGYALKNR